MMGSLIGLLVGKQIFGKTITEGGARTMLTAALFLLFLGVLGGIVAYIRHDAVGDYQTKQVARAAPATDKAATERANDAIEGARQQQEMHDVIEAQPDQPIAPTSHARGCEQLRRAGRSVAACSGPASGH